MEGDTTNVIQFQFSFPKSKFQESPTPRRNLEKHFLTGFFTFHRDVSLRWFMGFRYRPSHTVNLVVAAVELYSKNVTNSLDGEGIVNHNRAALKKDCNNGWYQASFRRDFPLELLECGDCVIGVKFEIPESEFDWRKMMKERFDTCPVPDTDACPKIFQTVAVTGKPTEENEESSCSKKPKLAAMARYPRPSSDVLEALDFVIETKDEKLIWCHRNILNSNNPVFGTLLCTEMTEKKSSEVTVEFDAAIMMELLHVIYTKEISPNFPGLELYDLLLGAEKYGLDRLKLICEEKLIEQLDLDKSVEYLVIADRFKLELLRDMAKNMISDSIAAVRKTEKGKEMAENLWMEVLEVIQRKLNGAVKVPYT